MLARCSIPWQLILFHLRSKFVIAYIEYIIEKNLEHILLYFLIMTLRDVGFLDHVFYFYRDIMLRVSIFNKRKINIPNHFRLSHIKYISSTVLAKMHKHLTLLFNIASDKYCVPRVWITFPPKSNISSVYNDRNREFKKINNRRVNWLYFYIKHRLNILLLHIQFCLILDSNWSMSRLRNAWNEFDNERITRYYLIEHFLNISFLDHQFHSSSDQVSLISVWTSVIIHMK